MNHYHCFQELEGKLLVLGLFDEFLGHFDVDVVKPLVTHLNRLLRIHTCEIAHVVQDEFLHLVAGDSTSNALHIKKVLIIVILDLVLFPFVAFLLRERELDLLEPGEDIALDRLDLEEKPETPVEVALHLVQQDAQAAHGRSASLLHQAVQLVGCQVLLDV